MGCWPRWAKRIKRWKLKEAEWEEAKWEEVEREEAERNVIGSDKSTVQTVSDFLQLAEYRAKSDQNEDQDQIAISTDDALQAEEVDARKRWVIEEWRSCKRLEPEKINEGRIQGEQVQHQKDKATLIRKADDRTTLT